MKMRMILLFSAVTLLVGPAAVSARHLHESAIQQKLNWIYDLAENCSESLTEDFFVEEAPLAEGRNRCGDKFFCKVHEILHNYQNDICGQTGTKLVRYLNTYNTGKNCAETLQGMTKRGVNAQVSTLLENVQRCVQRVKFNGGKK